MPGPGFPGPPPGSSSPGAPPGKRGRRLDAGFVPPDLNIPPAGAFSETTAITENTVGFPNRDDHYQVGASSDDASENASGTVTLTGTKAALNTTAQTIAGFRFPNVRITRGAIVAAADVQFNCNNGKASLLDVDIYAEAADDGATFTTSTSNISTRTKTTAKVTWTVTSAITPNGLTFDVSPDISAVIQEVVNRPGWVYGNAINILVVARSTSSYEVNLWDGGATSAAELDIRVPTSINVSGPSAEVTWVSESISFRISPLTVRVTDSVPVTDTLRSTFRIRRSTLRGGNTLRALGGTRATMSATLITVSDTSAVTENAVCLIPVYNLAVSDTSGVTESVPVLETSVVSVSDTTAGSDTPQFLLTSFVAVSETSAVTEAVAELGTALISVSDTSSVTENLVQPLATNFINVSDSSTVIDAFSELDVEFIAVSDTTAVTDAQTVLVPGLLVTVSDTTAVTENVAELLLGFVTVSESSTITEALQELIANLVSVSDTSGVTESLQELATGFASVSDTSGVTESLKELVISDVMVSDASGVTEQTVAGFGMLIAVSDSSTVIDAFSELDVEFVAVSDSSAVTESSSVLVPGLLIAVSDASTATESLVELNLEFVAVTDSSAVTESVTMLATNFISVSDSSAVTEAVTTTILTFVSVSDTRTVTDAIVVAAANLGAITVADASVVTEAVQQLVTGFVSVSDASAVSEALQELSTAIVSVSDSSAATDVITVRLLSFVTVSESTAISDTVSVTVPQLGAITLSDTSSVTEFVQVLMTSAVVIADSSAIADSVQELLTSLITVSDTSAGTDALQELVTNFVAVSESSTVAEVASATVVGVGDIAVNDSVALSEVVSALVTSFVVASDTCGSTDTVGVTLGNELSLSVAETSTVTDLRVINFTLGVLVSEGGVTSSDDFNRADTGSISTPWTQVSGTNGIRSNQYGSEGSTFGAIRHGTDLGSSDMFTQVEVGIANGDSRTKAIYAYVRFSNSAFTAYVADLAWTTTADPVLQLQKFVAGSATILSQVTLTGVTVAVGDTLRLEAVGSNLRVLYQGVKRLDITDTSITAGTRGGTGYFISAASLTNIAVDNYQAGTLVGAAQDSLVVAPPEENIALVNPVLFTTPASPRVIAAYYPWFARPDVHNEDADKWKYVIGTGWVLTGTAQAVGQGNWGNWTTGAHPTSPTGDWTGQAGTTPPENIAAPYYPQLGAYSSSDVGVVRQHMQWLLQAGFGTVLISWWGRGSVEHGRCPMILDEANAVGLKVYFEIDADRYKAGSGAPEAGTSVAGLISDLKHLIDVFGQHPAFLRISRPTEYSASTDSRPFFSVWDHKQLLASEWVTQMDLLHADATYNSLVIGNQVSAVATDVTSYHIDGMYAYGGGDPSYNRGYGRIKAVYDGVGSSGRGALFLPSAGMGADTERINTAPVIGETPIYDYGHVSDDFNRADSASLSSVDPWGRTITNWTQIGTAGLQIKSNGLTILDASGVYAAARHAQDMTTGNHWSQITLGTIAASTLAAAYTHVRQAGGGISTTSYYYAGVSWTTLNNATLWLAYWSANAGHAITSVPLTGITLVAGDVIRLEAEGTNLRVFYRGTKYIDVTNTQIPDQTASWQAGCSVFENGGFSTNVGIDRFEAGLLQPFWTLDKTWGQCVAFDPREGPAGQAEMVLVTFNEHGEGHPIEPCVAHFDASHSYTYKTFDAPPGGGATTFITKNALAVRSLLGMSSTGMAESTIVSDIPTMVATSFITVADTSAVTDTRQGLLLSLVPTSDTVTVSEVMSTVVPSLGDRQVFDTVTVADIPTLLMSVAAAVSDLSGANDSIIALQTAFVSVTDATTVTETVTPLVTALVVASDSSSLTEPVVMETTSRVVVSDPTTASDTVQGLVTSVVAVTDTTAVTDATQSLNTNLIAVSESSSVTEVRIVAPPLLPVVAADIAVINDVVRQPTMTVAVAVSDTVTVTQSVKFLAVHLIKVKDSSAVSTGSFSYGYGLNPQGTGRSITNKELGFDWIRLDFQWCFAQTTRGAAINFNWNNLEDKIIEANNFGVKVLLQLNYPPAWATSNNQIRGYPNAADVTVFADACARHWGRKVAMWELWNEPNNPTFMKPTPDLQIYVQNFLMPAYAAIHNAVPDAFVINGGCASGEANGDKIYDWLQGLYTYGGGNSFDGWGVHTYVGTHYPTDPPGSFEQPYYQIGNPHPTGWNGTGVPAIATRSYRQVMDDNGDSLKPIVPTESGYRANDANPPSSFHVTEAVAADYLVAMLSEWEAYDSAGNRGPYFLFAYSESNWATDPNQYTYGIYGDFPDDTRAKPAVAALKTWLKANNPYGGPDLRTPDSVVLKLDLPGTRVTDTISPVEFTSVVVPGLGTVHAADFSDITETVQLFVPTLKPMVVDVTAVTENITNLVTNRVNVSTTSSVTETIQRAVTDLVSVADTSLVIDNLQNLVTGSLIVADTATVTESLTVGLPTLLPKVSDVSSVSDVVTITTGTMNVSRSDTVAVQSLATVLIPTLALSVTDAGAVTDSVQALSSPASLLVTVTDTGTVSDSIQMLAAIGVVISDATGITEALQRQVTSFVQASQTVSVSEFVRTVRISLLAATETITVTDAVAALVVLPVITTDISAVTDTISVVVGATTLRSVTVADVLVVSESLQRRVTAFVTCAETSSVVEVVQLLASESRTGGDTGTDTEAASIAQTRVETGLGHDGQSVSTGALNETGTSSEAWSISATLTRSDVASGAEAPVNVAQTRAETALGLSGQITSTTSPDQTETGTGTDNARVDLVMAETVAATEGFSQDQTATEVITVAEATQIEAVLPAFTDFGFGVDEGSIGIAQDDVITAIDDTLPIILNDNVHRVFQENGQGHDSWMLVRRRPRRHIRSTGLSVDRRQNDLNIHV